jgi:uncharacterized membrane protein
MYIRYFIYFFVVGFAILLIQKLSLVPSILLIDNYSTTKVINNYNIGHTINYLYYF